VTLRLQIEHITLAGCIFQITDLRWCRNRFRTTVEWLGHHPDTKLGRGWLAIQSGHDLGDSRASPLSGHQTTKFGQFLSGHVDNTENLGLAFIEIFGGPLRLSKT
jgi:hypothetical protein